LRAHEEVLDVTKRLISFRSTADRPSEIRACIDYVKDYFSDTPLLVREFTFAGKPALVISFNRRKRFKLLLNGHIDVVDGNETQFTAVEKDGRLYGRGTNDMKGSVATMMVLMRRTAAKGLKLDVGLLIVSDEEIGGKGTAEFARRGYLADFLIFGEPTKLRIETKHKGVMMVTVTAYGSSSHGSRPWLGNNAIEKLIRQLQKLHEEIPQATRSNKWLPTVNVTSFMSDFPPNVTPSKAEMTLDIRTTEEWSNRRVKAIFKKLKLKYKILFEGAMLTNKRKVEQIRKLRTIADRVVGKKRKYVKSCGSTDARYYHGKGVPVAVIGPTGDNHHKQNEYVEIDALGKFYRILKTYFKEEVVD
jgi:succinyl-diaminopimelate desuccinylase